jgi:primosomal protein N' (replication factor Y)
MNDFVRAPAAANLPAPLEIPPLELSPEKQTLYARVVIDRAQSSRVGELTYGIPPALLGVLRPGFAVLVPFGRQTVTGYVVGFTHELEFDADQLRFISELASRSRIFDDSALRVARWMSAYYHCPLAECLACCMPQGWQAASVKKYAYVGKRGSSLPTLGESLPAEVAPALARSPRRRKIAQILMDAARPLSAKEIAKLAAFPESAVSRALTTLTEENLVAESEELPSAEIKPRRVRAASLSENFSLSRDEWEKLEKNAPRQFAALRRLQTHARSEAGSTPTPTAALARDFGIEASALSALAKKGWIKIVHIEQQRTPTRQLPPPDKKSVRLSSEQENAVQKISALLQAIHEKEKATSTNSHTLLLQGVTASGKTEVYLHAIEICLQLKKRALVLVPEIALTAQTVEIFQRRFQERVAILHSALSAGERFDEWRKIRSGRADIVVGARSAIFAPIRDLGLIVMDEEHDHSYKQDATPRYHARDVACKRAQIEGAVLVLGSATPSLESWQRAMKGEYSHVRLKARVSGRALPEVEIVDMTEEAKMGALPVLSSRLKDELCATVARGEQAIIFLNRRGFATYVQCVGCGHSEQCPNCDIALTFHRAARELRCHHCGFVKGVPEECPQCQGWMLGFTGTGTEKVEAEVLQLLSKCELSHVKTLRLDRDTTERKGAHGDILGQFRAGRAQVLIGTQMVTKGLDFPNVTLVGVISADTALNVPDFRAAERTFQLLAQVAGRAGRGEKPGKVLIQTLATDHYAIESAVAQNFEMFVEQEIGFRRDPPYPPFSYIVNIVSSDEVLETARARIEQLALKFHDAVAAQAKAQRGSTPGNKSDAAGGGCEILGPVECPIARVKNKFRFHLMLRDRNRPRLHRILRVFDELPREARDGLMIDVDAMTIL